MAIDNAVDMAVAVQARKGVYALLLGSGLSRSAGIPTGWEVVIDLINRLAMAEKQSISDDPVEWYQERFGEEPSYSRLLERLGRTPSERTALLRPYFEPDSEEREQGLKLPTAAHKSVAKLVADGYIRVIVTTNFDRLLERAIEAEGISPTVVSSDDFAQGMMPLAHTECLVLKLHGDYLDTRLRNTPDELAEYPDSINTLLDRILSDYGLIICGWSGDWDEALASAIVRNSRFRFTTYWLSRSSPSAAATRIINARQGVVVPIQSADEAFESLTLRVSSIALHLEPNPMSTKIAIASMKQMLTDDKYRIRLHDAIVAELSQAIKMIGNDHLPVGGIELNAENYSERMRIMASASAKLAAMVATGVMWDGGERDSLWRRCLVGLSSRVAVNGVFNPALRNLQMLPATVVLYSAMAVAIHRSRLDLITLMLLKTKAASWGDEQDLLIHQLGLPRCVVPEFAQGLHKSRRATPASDWLVGEMVRILEPVVGADVDIEDLFDEVEFIFSLLLCDNSGGFTGDGRFMWRRSIYTGREAMHERLDEEIQLCEQKNVPHRFVASGLFKDHERLRKALDIVGEAGKSVRLGR